MGNEVKSSTYTFRQFKALVDAKIGRYYDDYRFTSANSVFAAQLWNSPSVYINEDTCIIVPDITITYSLSTGKWYLHNTFDGFSVSEGNSLEEVLPGHSHKTNEEN